MTASIATIRCHFSQAPKKQGVNLMLFNNGECILSVHHHSGLGKIWPNGLNAH